MLRLLFCLWRKRSHPPAPLRLLFRKRARSARLLGCKRPRDGSLSLPPFCGCLRSKRTAPAKNSATVCCSGIFFAWGNTKPAALFRPAGSGRSKRPVPDEAAGPCSLSGRDDSRFGDGISTALSSKCVGLPPGRTSNQKDPLRGSGKGKFFLTSGSKSPTIATVARKANHSTEMMGWIRHRLGCLPYPAFLCFKEECKRWIF